MFSTRAVFGFEGVTQGLDSFFDGYAVDVGRIAHVKVDLQVFDVDVCRSWVAGQKDVLQCGKRPASELSTDRGRQLSDFLTERTIRLYKE